MGTVVAPVALSINLISLAQTHREIIKGDDIGLKIIRSFQLAVNIILLSASITRTTLTLILKFAIKQAAAKTTILVAIGVCTTIMEAASMVLFVISLPAIMKMGDDIHKSVYKVRSATLSLLDSIIKQDNSFDNHSSLLYYTFPTSSYVENKKVSIKQTNETTLTLQNIYDHYDLKNVYEYDEDEDIIHLEMKDWKIGSWKLKDRTILRINPEMKTVYGSSMPFWNVEKSALEMLIKRGYPNQLTTHLLGTSEESINIKQNEMKNVILDEMSLILEIQSATIKKTGLDETNTEEWVKTNLGNEQIS